MMYIKLKAQRLLIGKNSKAFLVSILPFLMSVTFCVLNYCFLIYLIKNNDLNKEIKPLLFCFVAIFSLFTQSSVAYICENYFYRKATDSFTPVSAKDLFCAFAVRILKFLLFWFWSAIFFLPSVVVFLTGFSIKNSEYPIEIYKTLLVSSGVLAVLGAGCLFAVFKRFSKSYFVQFKTGETSPLRVLSKSCEMMEGSLIKYSLFCISFLGWDTLCLSVIPIIYVLPYRKSAKYVFFNEKKKSKPQFVESEKPIVFIFSNP